MAIIAVLAALLDRLKEPAVDVLRDAVGTRLTVEDDRPLERAHDGPRRRAKPQVLLELDDQLRVEFPVEVRGEALEELFALANLTHHLLRRSARERRPDRLAREHVSSGPIARGGTEVDRSARRL